MVVEHPLRVFYEQLLQLDQGGRPIIIALILYHNPRENRISTDVQLRVFRILKLGA